MGKCYVTRLIGDSGGGERPSEHVHRSNVTRRLLHLAHMFLVKIKQMFNILVCALNFAIRRVFSALNAMQSSLNISSLTVHLCYDCCDKILFWLLALFELVETESYLLSKSLIDAWKIFV